MPAAGGGTGAGTGTTGEVTGTRGIILPTGILPTGTMTIPPTGTIPRIFTPATATPITRAIGMPPGGTDTTAITPAITTGGAGIPMGGTGTIPTGGIAKK